MGSTIIKRALQLIGYMSDDSDKNANDNSEIDSVVDAADVGDVSEFIGNTK